MRSKGLSDPTNRLAAVGPNLPAEKQDAVAVCALFFHGIGWWWPASVLAYSLTGQPWQKPEEVPSHCALLFSWREQTRDRSLLFESLANGVRCEEWDNSPKRKGETGLIRELCLQVPRPGDTFEFCKNSLDRSLKYDWRAVLCDAFHVCFLETARSADGNYSRYSCNRFVAAALSAGGLDLPSGSGRLSPNHLMLRLLDMQKGPIENGLNVFTKPDW